MQSFYDTYFDKLNAEVAGKHTLSAEEQVIRQRPPVLASELSQMLTEDRDVQDKHPGYITGLDFDPFLNAQDWDGSYWVQEVNLQDGICRASVWGTDADEKKAMVAPKLAMLNDNWLFVDFFYPESRQHGDVSLMGLLTDLREQRQQAKSKRPHR